MQPKTIRALELYSSPINYQSTTVPAPGATSLLNGLANTNAIIAQTGQGQLGVGITSDYAAGLCRNYNGGGFNDWYLPSKDELNYLWENLADSDGDYFNSGPTDPNNLGGFAYNIYWSSTEYDNSDAWKKNFSNGLQYLYDKNSTGFVRAVRAF